MLVPAARADGSCYTSPHVRVTGPFLRRRAGGRPGRSSDANETALLHGPTPEDRMDAERVRQLDRQHDRVVELRGYL